MKRSLEALDGNLEFDLPELDSGFLDALLAEDPKKLRAQGGVPPLCEDICDTLYDPSSDFNIFQDGWKEAQAVQSKGTTQSSGSSTSGPQERSPGALGAAQTNGAAADWQWLSWMPQPGQGRLDQQPPSGSGDSGSLQAACGVAERAPLPTMHSRGRAGSKNPSPSALAQRRYHERQKSKKADSDRKLSEIMQQMEQLKLEKKELELKNRILETDLQDWQEHVEELWGNSAFRSIQQTKVLQLIVDLINQATGKSISLSEALEWTLQEYIDVHFQALVDRQLALCEVALQDPSSWEHKELCSLATQHWDLEAKGAMSSCIHNGLLFYNHGEAERRVASLPGPAFWEELLEGMRLSQTQVDWILDCHEKVHAMLVKIAEERNSIILPQLGLEAMQTPMDKIHRCPAANLLYRSYRAEQTAVMGFLLFMEKVLSLPQRVYMDFRSYPWCPEWLELCAVLARKRGKPPLTIPALGNRGMTLPVIPRYTALEVLQKPTTALGIGMRLRHGIILCPCLTVMSAACFMPIPQERLRKMKLLDVMIGRFRQMTCWEWMQQVRMQDRIIENSPTEEGSEEDSHGLWL